MGSNPAAPTTLIELIKGSSYPSRLNQFSEALLSEAQDPKQNLKLAHEKLILSYREKLLKSLRHLEYSYQKVLSLPTTVLDNDEESLETWESFSSRFSRTADLFLTKYLRAVVLREDPGFQGSLRDYVHQGEKLGLLDDARAWMSIREFRNVVAHDDTEAELAVFYASLLEYTPRLLKLKEHLSP